MKNLLGDISITGFADEREGQQENICTSVTQRPQLASYNPPVLYSCKGCDVEKQNQQKPNI
jgi:hypothetical protein